MLSVELMYQLDSTGKLSTEIFSVRGEGSCTFQPRIGRVSFHLNARSFIGRGGEKGTRGIAGKKSYLELTQQDTGGNIVLSYL